MKAIDLYERLERDFIYEGMWDDWAGYMGGIEDLLSPNFKKRSMGLVADFAENVTKAYTSVFPSENVMERILARGATDAMLFVHHAAVWDIRNQPVWRQIKREWLERFKENRISIYNLHVPLDNYGEFSTSKSLADALVITVEKPFCPYRGGLAGIIGKTRCSSAEELNQAYSRAVGHPTRLYPYGESFIQGGRIAVCAGGGNDMTVVTEMLENDVRVLVTGITVENAYSAETHAFEKANKVNVLGGTHYSSEQFACRRMCEYFERLGLPSEFIQDEPIFEDM